MDEHRGEPEEEREMHRHSDTDQERIRGRALVMDESTADKEGHDLIDSLGER